MTAPLIASAIADRYRIERELGRGGMATVYLANDIKHRRHVAVKVLHPELAAMLGAERFLREIETTASLRHPHILPLFDSGEAGDARASAGGWFLYYVMPFVEGESLRDRLRREPRLPVADAIQIASEVADALGYAHARGVIHRDIKPENILLEGGHAIVADFGIARAVSASDDRHLTQTGTAIGTPSYMSPEQALGDTTLDGRSDLYSLGCVLFEMLTGEPPFVDATVQRMIARRLTEAAPDCTTSRPDVDSAVSAAIRRVLSAEPASRPATAADFIAELTAPTPGLPVASDSGASHVAEGFWVAVLPFRTRGTSADLSVLAEDLTEEIVTGLSRFSYLRVIARSSAARFAGETGDVRAIGRELGARYVMEGSVRQAGSTLRVSVQLVDASTGAHLWVETYDRAVRAEDIFALQEELVPRIVSSVADMHGVLPHSMSEALRDRNPVSLSPYEALLRSYGYLRRISPDEHATVRAILEQAVERAPGHADCLAMLAAMYTNEFIHGFNRRADPLGRAIQTARRAVEAAPSNHLAHYGLAEALFYAREFQPFKNTAERVIALNRMDGYATAYMGMLLAFSGEWERGCALVERGFDLNSNQPAWLWIPGFVNRYRKHEYREALDAAFKIVVPGHWYPLAALAATYGQLGEIEAAGRAMRELLALWPAFPSAARGQFAMWHEQELVEHLIMGLRKAGLPDPP